MTPIHVIAGLLEVLALRLDETLAARTAVHFGAGLGLGLKGTSFGRTAGMLVAYEVAEQIVERTGRGRRFFRSSGPEKPANVAIDLGVALFGWWLGKRWSR